MATSFHAKCFAFLSLKKGNAMCLLLDAFWCFCGRGDFVRRNQMFVCNSGQCGWQLYALDSKWKTSLSVFLKHKRNRLFKKGFQKPWKMSPWACSDVKIWSMHLAVFWITLLYPSGSALALGKENSRRCRHFSTTESFEIGRSKGKLLEVHLRQNIRVRSFLINLAVMLFLLLQGI